MARILVCPTERFPFVGRTDTMTDAHADFFIRDLVAIREPRVPRPAPAAEPAPCSHQD